MWKSNILQVSVETGSAKAEDSGMGPSCGGGSPRKRGCHTVAIFAYSASSKGKI